MFTNKFTGFCLSILLPLGLAQTIDNSVNVKTSEGRVVGTRANNGDYFAFYGIPFAGPTSGEHRFKAAPPPSKYDELVANRNDIICAQPSLSGLLGVEDCLTLNVFTKNVTTIKPVIVWLTGEDYSSTNSTRQYSFKSLVEANIVFIEVNYRLSIFGFLCLGVTEAPGNAGLKDVIQALKWVQKNVLAFGGDPKNVMLLGHGSGAAMVDLITMSSEKLVHKAISLSGSALSPWAIAYDPLGYAKALGSKVGLQDPDVQQLAKNLQNVDTNTLNKAINTFGFTNQSVLFAPCVENQNLDGWFLRDAPINLLRSGSYNQVPYIAGYVDIEGTMRVREALSEKWLERMQKNFVDFLPIDLTFTDEVKKFNISQNLRIGYFGDGVIEWANIRDFFAYEGDSLIVNAALRSVKERVKTSEGAVRLLTFSFPEVSSVDGWPYKEIILNGTRHGGILDYIFDLEYRKVSDIPKEKLLKRIVAFAKTGIPDPNINIGDPKWEPITTEKFSYLNIYGKENKIAEYIGETEITTKVPWDDIINKYYKAPSAVSSASKNNNFSAIITITVLCSMLSKLNPM